MIKEATVRRPQRKNPDSSSGVITMYSSKHAFIGRKHYQNLSQRKEAMDYWKSINKTGYYIISPDIND